LVSKIIGEAVINRRNEELGEIHDTDRCQGGSLAFARCLLGGFRGGSCSALPQAFEFATTENKLGSTSTRRSRAAPGFDSDASGLISG
jgi:hypothetical protein